MNEPPAEVNPLTAGDLMEFEEIDGFIVTIEAAPFASNDNLDLVLLCLGRLEVGVTPFFNATGEVVEPLTLFKPDDWAGV